MARRIPREPVVRTYGRKPEPEPSPSAGWGIATLTVLVIASVLVVGWAADWWEPEETREGAYEEQTGFITTAEQLPEENRSDENRSIVEIENS